MAEAGERVTAPEDSPGVQEARVVRLTQALHDVQAALEAEVEPGLTAAQMVAEFRLRMDQAVIAAQRAIRTWGESDD